MRHDFAGVIERMELLRAPLEYAWGVMSHLTGVKNSDPLRDAHQELQVGGQGKEQAKQFCLVSCRFFIYFLT